jgi:aspartate/methionine/tyrosine aminotransferase
MELANNLLNNSSDNINLDILDKSKIELEDLFLSYNWELIKNKERTMYIFPVNKNIDIDVFIENLLHNGIGVISGKAFGYNQAIRITLPNNLETLQKIKNIIISTLQ